MVCNQSQFLLQTTQNLFVGISVLYAEADAQSGEILGEQAHLWALPPVRDAGSACGGHKVWHKRWLRSWIRNLMTRRRCDGAIVSLQSAQSVITIYWRTTIGSSPLLETSVFDVHMRHLNLRCACFRWLWFTFKVLESYESYES